MRFTLKRMLLWFVPLGFVCAVLQRPLRDPEVYNGFLASIYPWLWLCYAEELVTHEPMMGKSPLGVFAVMIGAMVQIFLFSASPFLLAGLYRWLKQPESDDNGEALD